MFEEYYHLIGTPIIYLLLVEPGYYKFGITRDIYRRLHTHKRVLKFISVVRIFTCVSKNSSLRIEQKFKKFAASVGILVKKYNQTEIIATDEPQKYVDWFLLEVKSETESLGLLALVDDIKFDGLPRLRLPKTLMPRSPPPVARVASRFNKKLEIHRLVQNNVVETSVVPYNKINQPAQNFKCIKCGKVFKLEKYFNQHNRRKTPCGIVEVNNNSPNKCIYCNRTYSNKYTLARHHKFCTIKNNRIKVLPDANRVEEKLRIIEEERKKEREERERREKEREETQKRFAELQASFEARVAYIECLLALNEL